jgi:hypothetical protein
VCNLGIDDKAAAIVRAVIGLCDALGMSTIAEGVENTEQVAMLWAQGCRQVQGSSTGLRCQPTRCIALSSSNARPPDDVPAAAERDGRQYQVSSFVHHPTALWQSAVASWSRAAAASLGGQFLGIGVARCRRPGQFDERYDSPTGAVKLANDEALLLDVAQQTPCTAQRM